MTEDSVKSTLRPAWRLVIAMAAGLALAVMVLAWPAIVRGDTSPVITQVEVTSSKSGFFYSPPLADTGGSVYFNSLSGAGAGQIISVTVTVSDTDPIHFDGGSAFGSTPSTGVPTTNDGTTSTWVVAYTIGADAPSQNGVVFTVTDSLSDTGTISINFIQDNAAPVVNLIDVTDPQYDPDGNELDSINNWYRTSLLGSGWAFTSNTEDNGSGLASGSCTWDHQSGTDYDQALSCGTGGDGLFPGVDNNPDGTVTVTVTLTDMVGNAASDVVVLELDDTPPTISSPSIYDYNSDYLHPVGTDIYYGNDMPSPVSFTVQGHAVDGGSGLDRATFAQALMAGKPGDDFEPSAWAGTYTIDYTDWGNGNILVTVYDKVGNFASQTFHYERDTSNPTISDVSISAASPYLYAVGSGIYYSDQMGSNPETFSVQGSASDAGSGYSHVTFPSAFGETPPADTNSPWQGVYSVTSSNNGNGSIVVTAFDNVANTVTSTFIYTEDITPPAVTLDDVTDPGYDAADGELDNDGSNWYAAADLSPDWTFTSTTSDSGSGLASGTCTWDHQSDAGSDQTSDCGPDGSGSFSDVADDPDGTVTVTVVISDQVGNSASDSVVLNIDKTPPAITNPSIEAYDSHYLHVVGTTVYYGNDMGLPQTFTVQGNASDTGVGLGSSPTAAVTFSSALSDHPSNYGTPDNWKGDYNASSSDSDSGSITVTVYDLLGNSQTQSFDYTRDIGNPSSDASSPQYDNGGTIPVDWTASDTGSSGMGSTVLWYKKGSGGSWTDSGLTQDGVSGSFQFTPSGDEVYYFATRATDNVGNQEDGSVPPSGEGDTSTIFDTAQPVVNASPIQESSPYLYVTGTTLYYGNKMTSAQTFTIEGTASDPNPGTGSGLDRATFSPAFGDTPPDVLTPATWSGVYDVASTDTGNGSISVDISDHAGNTTSKLFSYVRDVTSPNISVHASYNQDQNSFDVYWGGSTDTGAGIANYVVEYCLGDQVTDCGESGTWVPWLNNLPSTTTSSSFGPSSPASLDPDKIYRFRVTATDRVKNDGSGLSNIVEVGIRYVYLATIFNNNDPTVPDYISGDFETGTFAGWKVGGVLPSSIVTHPVPPTGGTPPGGGTYAALLGSPSYGCKSTPNVPVGQAYIKAYVNVPNGGTPFLRFQYRVLSYDAGRTKSGDPWERLEVQVNNTALERYGNPKYEGLSCSDLYDSQWKSAEFDLSSYAGQTVLLTFFVNSNPEPEGGSFAYLNTYAYLDNIRIEVGP
jgi:hypothetical protein